MKSKYLSLIFASIVITFAPNQVLNASTNDSNSTFHCKTEGETLTTIAKKADGSELTIFHWKDEVLPQALNSQDICQEVSQKLQVYSTEGDRVSSFKTYDMGGVPAICAEEQVGVCSLVLLTLDANFTQVDSNSILQGILDDSLKGEEITFNERGIQSYGYKVSFWDLLGF
ncbi:MAG: COP23 domain-containing protein [Xenococcus sp. (in: cyanobacteria)]